MAAPLAGSQAIDVLDRHESGVGLYLDCRDTTIAELSRIPDGDILRFQPAPGIELRDSPIRIRRRDFLARGAAATTSVRRTSAPPVSTLRHGSAALDSSRCRSPAQRDPFITHPNPVRPRTSTASSLHRTYGNWPSSSEKDRSVYRNLLDWSVPSTLRPPLVSVAIATKDRGAMIADSLHSVLFQTFQDFEIIVVDDGSEDDLAEQTIREIDVPRITLRPSRSAGISLRATAPRT